MVGNGPVRIRPNSHRVRGACGTPALAWLATNGTDGLLMALRLGVLAPAVPLFSALLGCAAAIAIILIVSPAFAPLGAGGFALGIR